MSVHDDGPPSWREPPKPDPDQPTADWVSPIEKEALKLLSDLIENKDNITSLEFKRLLRVRCIDMEPAPKVVQEDVSKFLKRWFLNVGAWDDVGGGAEKAGYAFREHKSPTTGGTYNEYFYAPEIAGRQEEKQLEDAIVEAQLSGEAPVKGLWAWIKSKLGRRS